MSKKIIHISLGKANPNRMNGVNKVLSSLITAQVNQKKDAQYWGISFSKEHNYPKRNFKTTLFMDSKMKFFLDEKIKKKLVGLKNQNDTIIHLHGAFLPQIYSIARILVKCKIPYVFTPHGGYNLKAIEKSKFSKIVFINFFERFVVEHAQAVHIIGKSEQIGLERYFKPKQIILVPNGQNAYDINHSEKETTPFLHLGYLGRIDIRTKGLDILLQAITQIKAEINIKLSVIGAGGEIEKLKHYIDQYQLQNHVCLEGAKFGDEKYALLHKLDAFCLISRNEGLPGVVLEAAAVGTPSILSEGTNMTEYISTYNSGWNMTEYSAKHLANLLKQVEIDKKNSVLKQKSHNCTEMIEKEFKWATIAAKMNSLYA